MLADVQRMSTLSGFKTYPGADTPLRQLFEFAPEGIFIADTDGKYVDVNKAGCELLAKSRDEIIGKSIIDLIPEEDIARLWKERDDMKTGKSTVTSEWKLRRSDGTFVPVEISAAILDDGHWLGYVRDISKRIQLETALRHALERETAEYLRLAAVCEQLPEGIIILDEKGHMMKANDVAMRYANTSREGSLTKDLYGNEMLFDMRRITGEMMPMDEIPVVRALRTGARVSNVELCLYHQGRMIPVLANAAPISDDHGTIRGAVVIFNDMTDIKEMERLRQEWVTIVAHDLRQPVQNILLSTELLKQSAETQSSAFQKNLSAIESSIRGLNRLVEDLFDAARMATQQFSIRREKIDLRALVENVGKQTGLSSGRTIRINVHGAGPYTAHGDPQRIEQILDNLLTNVVKYSTKDTDIVLDLKKNNDEFLCSVSNCGRGLQPEEMERLFTRFYRVPGSHKVAKGSGLGLHIAKGLVEAHGGRIWSESVPDKMTVFSFTLPLDGNKLGTT